MTKTLGTIVHLGAGRGEELIGYLERGFHRIVLVEANPALAARLRERSILDDRVEVAQIAVAARRSAHQLLAFNVAAASSLRTPTGLLRLYPGIRTTAKIEVEVVAVSEFLHNIRLDAETFNVLVIDVPGEEFDIVEHLIESGKVLYLSEIIVYCSKEELYEASRSAEDVLAMFYSRGYEVEPIREIVDPDRPAWKVRAGPAFDAFNRLAAEAKRATVFESELRTVKAALAAEEAQVRQLDAVIKAQSDRAKALETELTVIKVALAATEAQIRERNTSLQMRNERILVPEAEADAVRVALAAGKTQQEAADADVARAVARQADLDAAVAAGDAQARDRESAARAEAARTVALQNELKAPRSALAAEKPTADETAHTAAKAFAHGNEFVFMHNDRADHIFNIIRTTGKFYEAELLDACADFVSPRDLVVDVGANIGNHTVFFAGVLSCRVIAVEPNPTAVAILQRNVAANDLGRLVRIETMALGEEKGFAQIQHPADQPHNLGVARTVAIDRGPVTVGRLGDLELHGVKLIKIDVEGAELAVIRGAGMVLQQRPVLLIESEQDFDELAAEMKRHGYVCTQTFNYTATHLFMPLERAQADPVMFDVSRRLGRAEIDKRLAIRAATAARKLDMNAIRALAAGVQEA